MSYTFSKAVEIVESELQEHDTPKVYIERLRELTDCSIFEAKNAAERFFLYRQIDRCESIDDIKQVLKRIVK